MNASPSAQSVGSLKPSTAASNASGKRTRTIIVARNLPDAPVAPVPTSSSSAHPGRHTGGHGAHHHHGSRDAKLVKLNSYAALGGDADVELYERFLSEKKASPSSGDGAPAGGNTPPVVTKRRTLGQLPIHSNASSNTKLESTPVQDTGDAKQRREAVMQHRKWLKSLPIHERLVYERQQNVLKKWKQINREWEEFKARTSKKLGKSENQLVMSRASEYREQIEMYDALQRAMPLSEKVGEDFWLVSLRSDGTRYVPVGNIFSGLYCPIRESSKLQPRVRRPLDYQDALASTGEDGDNLGHDKPLTTLERRSMEALARKKRRLKKQLNALFPHEVEPSQSGQLRVDTVDLFEWASSSQPNEFDDYDNNQLRDPTASTRSLLLPLDEEDQENTADGLNSRRSTARSRQTARSRPKKGPSMRVFLGDSLDETGGSAATLELGFFIDIDVAQQQSVYLENNGTTSLQFQWRRVELVDEQLLPRLTKHHPSPLEDSNRIAWTSISLREGVVLPGELIEFVFTFQSIRAGTWLEKWLLDVDPPLPNVANKREDAAACVLLQCTAVDNYVPSTQRKKLGERAAQAETFFMAEQVLKHDVIEKVDPQYVIAFPELDENARLFYDTHRRGAYESAQYSSKLVAECRELYETALVILQPPSNEVTVEEVPSMTSSTPREAPEPASPFASYPADWDQQLMTLKDLVLAADSRLESDYLALSAQQIAERQQQNADAEDDEEDEDEDLMERILGTKARKKVEQQAALRLLEPHFHDDFQSVVIAAQLSPHEPCLLAETLAEKLASMAGETPVVLEIARMQSRSPSEDDARQQAYALLGPLLVRAIDESFAIDQQRERVFEDAKRHFHSVALSHKKGFVDLPELLSEPPGEKPTVIFLQVDLDIANWFTLSTATDGSFLEWKLAQKLLDHDKHIPPKVEAAVQSIEKLLETVAISGNVPVLVLITELSCPPMNKATKKLEVAFATTKMTADKANSGSGDPPTPASPEEIEATRQKLEQKRNRLLSLRGVDSILQRAMAGRGLTIEFLSSLEELAAYKSTSPEPPGDNTDETELPATSPQQPRVVLVEHLGALARQALQASKSADPLTAAAAAPTAVDKGKAATPPTADKKKSVVAAPAMQTPLGASPADDEDDHIEVLPGMSLEMMAAQALGQRLAQLGNVLVVDFFPQSWWEATFVYFTSPPPAMTRPQSPNPNEDGDQNEEEMAVVVPPKHILVGPQLLKTFSQWQAVFQRGLPNPTTVSIPMKAVVGGRGLERKLRLMDGLVERVDAIYVVGEIAMAIFRVLHTKQVIKSIKRERKPVPRYECQRLIAPVERLIQKAYRKQVELLLPLDFVVGDTRVGVDAAIAPGDDDGDDDEAEEEEEEEEDDEDDDGDSFSRKKKAKKPKARVQKPLDEPPEIDTWQPRPSYDGERGLVELNTASGTWIRFADVTQETIGKVTVVQGNETLLEATDAGEDGEPSTVSSPKPVVLPELDWTHRVFDIGPKSTQVLLGQLQQQSPGWLFVNGTLGAVEFREFDVATRQLLTLVQATPQLTESLLVTGKSTAAWLRRLGQPTGKATPGVTSAVSSSTAKNAAVLSYIVETKQHAMLTAFDSV